MANRKRKPLTEHDKIRMREYSRMWRAKNRERHMAYQEKYREDHKEECYEKTKLWKENNLEYVRKYGRDYYYNKKKAGK